MKLWNGKIILQYRVLVQGACYFTLPDTETCCCLSVEMGQICSFMPLLPFVK